MFAIFVRKDGQEKLAAICDKYSQEDCIKEIMYDEGCTDGATELNADGSSMRLETWTRYTGRQ